MTNYTGQGQKDQSDIIYYILTWAGENGIKIRDRILPEDLRLNIVTKTGKGLNGELNRQGPNI